jgi:hypothetical protein
MSEKKWHICIDGNVFGPLDSKTVQVMLQQSRLQFVDFIWQAGMNQWQRISKVGEFDQLIPPYPAAAIPAQGNAAAVTQPKAPAKVKKAAAVQERPVTPVAPIVPVMPAQPVTPVKAKVRTLDRVKVAGKILIDGAGAFDVVDLSIGGIFVASPNLINVGTDIEFNIEIKGLVKSLDMTGIVVRHGAFEKSSGFAVEFTRPNPAYLRILSDFIEALQVGRAG